MTLTPDQIRTYLGLAAGVAMLGFGFTSGDAALIAMGAATLGVGPTTNSVINGHGKKETVPDEAA